MNTHVHHKHHYGQQVAGAHAHHCTPQNYGKVFGFVVAINVTFIIAEVIYGLAANSMSLIADAGHNSSDIIGLFLAWGAIFLSTRKPNDKYTYGLQGTSILASLANSILLFLAIGAIALESFFRLSNPEKIEGNTVMIVAAIGVCVNGFTAYLLKSGSKNDLNMKAAFAHFAADAAISLGVVLAAFIITQTGWLWLDPAVSLLISLVIIYSTWGLLKDSINLSLYAVPKHIEIAKVRQFLLDQPEVKEVHDLHVWATSTTDVELTAHLVMQNGHPGDDFIGKLSAQLEENFKINHSTIQIELGNCAEYC